MHGFSNDKSIWAGRALGVVEDVKIRNSVVGHPHPGERSHGDTVLEFHTTNLNGLKKIFKHFVM